MTGYLERRLRFRLAAAIVILFGIVAVLMWAQPPQPATVSQSYGLTLERDDLTAAGGVTTYSTAVTPRSNFVLVYRNGSLQREGADYVKASGSAVSFVVGGVTRVADGDLLTFVFQR